ncbi:MAG: 2-amino-4-hydroxy-6-hydroxymethyldihydropteridine diphosphokinase [Isosphaeraceae bacterium]
MAASPYAETIAVAAPPGKIGSGNVAVAIEMTLGPFDLLEKLQRIEGELGRSGCSVGSRTLDLDLLFFGNHQIGRDTISRWPSIPLGVGTMPG